MKVKAAKTLTPIEIAQPLQNVGQRRSAIGSKIPVNKYRKMEAHAAVIASFGASASNGAQAISDQHAAYTVYL